MTEEEIFEHNLRVTKKFFRELKKIDPEQPTLWLRFCIEKLKLTEDQLDIPMEELFDYVDKISETKK